MGRLLEASLIIGIRADYWKIDDTKDYSFLYYLSFHLMEQMESEANVIMPLIYLKYYRNISEKFIFNINLKGGYGFVNTDYTSGKAGISYTSSDSFFM